MLDSSASDSSVVDAAPDSPGPDSSAPDAEASLEPTPPPPPPPPSDEETARTALASRRPPPHYFVGVDLALATDVTPHLLFAGAPYVGYRTTRPILFGLGLSIRASFLRAGTGTIPATGGAADYLWTVGRLDGCAMLWPARPLRIGGCLRAEAGVLDVQGEQIIPAQTQHSAWVAGGLLARVDWSLFGPVFLDASGGPSLRITAHPFVFLPDTLVYEVPVVGFSAEAGVGVHFL